MMLAELLTTFSLSAGGTSYVNTLLLLDRAPSDCEIACIHVCMYMYMSLYVCMYVLECMMSYVSENL